MLTSRPWVSRTKVQDAPFSQRNLAIGTSGIAPFRNRWPPLPALHLDTNHGADRRASRRKDFRCRPSWLGGIGDCPVAAEERFSKPNSANQARTRPDEARSDSRILRHTEAFLRLFGRRQGRRNS